MTKFRTRLLFTLITLLVIVLVGLGLVLGQLFKNYYLNSFDERLKKESILVAVYVEDIGGIEAISHKRMMYFSQQLNARISIINSDGNIEYDSGEMDQISNEDYGDVIKRITENKTESINESKLVNNLHYYWEPILLEGTEEGFVLLSTKMTELKKAYSQIWWLLTISFGFALIVILILGR